MIDKKIIFFLFNEKKILKTIERMGSFFFLLVLNLSGKGMRR